MPRDCSSSAMPRTVVIPERLMSSTMPRRSAARWAALALMDATASALPTCLPRSARAPLGLPISRCAADRRQSLRRSSTIFLSLGR